MVSVFLLVPKVLPVEIITTAAAASAAAPAVVSQGIGPRGCWPEIRLQTPSSVTLQVGSALQRWPGGVYPARSQPLSHRQSSIGPVFQSASLCLRAGEHLAQLVFRSENSASLWSLKAIHAMCKMEQSKVEILYSSPPSRLVFLFKSDRTALCKPADVKYNTCLANLVSGFGMRSEDRLCSP